MRRGASSCAMKRAQLQGILASASQITHLPPEPGVLPHDLHCSIIPSCLAVHISTCLPQHIRCQTIGSSLLLSSLGTFLFQDLLPHDLLLCFFLSQLHLSPVPPWISFTWRHCRLSLRHFSIPDTRHSGIQKAIAIAAGSSVANAAIAGPLIAPSILSGTAEIRRCGKAFSDAGHSRQIPNSLA